MTSLRPLDAVGPDMSSRVVHFVTRNGTPNDKVPSKIRLQTPIDRLESVLSSGCINAYAPFAIGGDWPCVCFTEASGQALRDLINRGRYEPYGLAFNKDFVFEHRNGGPAYYVRADEWEGVTQGLPPETRYRATRLWPGGGGSPTNRLFGRSDYTFEREWRVPPDDGEPPGFRFETDDIEFVLLPNAAVAPEGSLLAGLATTRVVEWAPLDGGTISTSDLG